MPQRIPTLRSSSAVGHEAWAICDDCKHSRQLLLADFERRALADVPLPEVKRRLRCQCGGRRVSIVVSGGRHPGYWGDNNRKA